MDTSLFVSNASPIIGFERLDKLDLLQQLTTTLHIPEAVRREVFGTRAIPDWITVRFISQPLSSLPLSPRLGAGEREAIALAMELQPRYVLLDDLAARRAAQALNISVIGTVGLLILARQRNFVSALKPYLDSLLAADFRISETIYHLALRQVGEGE